jgi:hypothetical protein
LNILDAPCSQTSLAREGTNHLKKNGCGGQSALAVWNVVSMFHCGSPPAIWGPLMNNYPKRKQEPIPSVRLPAKVTLPGNCGNPKGNRKIQQSRFLFLDRLMGVCCILSSP